jgi:SAM-dependent methyltransferase
VKIPQEVDGSTTKSALGLMLERRCNSMSVFISWSGKRSRTIAEILGNWLGTLIPDSSPWVSTEIAKGEIWSREVQDQLKNSRFGLLCVNSQNFLSPWILFEAGALSNILAPNCVCPYLIDLNASQIKAPLSMFQAVQSTSKEDHWKLLLTINARQEHPYPRQLLEPAFEKSWQILQEEIKSAESIDEPLAKVDEMKNKLTEAIERLQNLSLFSENIYMQKLVIDSLERTFSRIRGIEPTVPVFRLPQWLYPTYLTRLLSTFNPTVKAVALVDQEELFWRSSAGNEILRNTPPTSTRVFVFQSRKHLEENIFILQKHAQKYNVRVLSFQLLASHFPDYCIDFSIIGDIDARLLATYDTRSQSILFSADKEEISRYEDAFSEIVSDSKIFDKTLPEEYGTDQLIEQIFPPDPGRDITILNRRPVEMSTYISVNDYDEHEEKHAYYQDMMSLMIRIIESKRRNKKDRIRILELGAGTGIFTKRLALIENAEIVALEIDWHCFNILRPKISRILGASKDQSTDIVCLNKDSRTYDHPGEFDFITSSFADHHIKPYDKEKYFANVKRNLKPGACLIVGDEFLPQYDKHDPESRRKALRSYHGHIIGLAEQQGATELAKLEQEALDSGLQEIGDFKLSCDLYEELLKKSGLNFEKHKIGPEDLPEVGGVYVYQIWPSPAQ